MDEDLAAALHAIGPRLRSLRQRQVRTLEQVAEATGISISTLSRLESGQRRPALEHLLPLARTYRAPLDELVDTPTAPDPRVRTRPLTRNGTTFHPLTRHQGTLQAYKVIIPPPPPARRRRAPAAGPHRTRMAVRAIGPAAAPAGEHDLQLDAGEVAEFDTRVPHALSNPGPGPVELLTLFGPDGERMHVRARPSGR
ncbi:MAG TPA: helix-turn-helix domain-containing protein [Euzebyales bacterium]|nr:helix-turn-helix domain-containing protein [Euzebyales bacterium]